MAQKYVFISYSNQNRSYALELREILRKKNISCWMDSQSISPGESHATEIPKAIEACDAFVVLISKESQDSPWVPKEIETAIKKDKKIFPLRIDTYELNRTFSYLLTNVQCINAYNNKYLAYEELVAQIYKVWNERPVTPVYPTSKETTSSSNSSSNSGGKFMLFLAALVVAIVLIAMPKDNKHVHTWRAATCTAPQICTECGETSGSPVGHAWQAATYTAPKTCSVCGATEGNPILDIVAGDTITMGSYGNEDIVWVVLDFDPVTNQALLISKYCLDAIPFHTGDGYGSWENSSLRRWLNNEFISQSFSQDERAIIVTRQISTADNSDFGTNSGNDTTDRIFVLSVEEAAYYFPSKTSRRSEPTVYCKDQGCYDPVKYAEDHDTEYDPESVGYTCWWLRTAGIDENRTANVFSNGTISTYGAYKSGNEVAVRPAMWVKMG